MKILLVKPYNLSDHIQPSLGLAYLASAVRKGREVRIVDCIKDGIRIDRFKSLLRRERPDVVGLQCYTFDIGFVKEALKVAKSLDRDIVTMIGGPHPSAVPVESMDLFGGDLDFLFAGEAEIGLPMLLDFLQKGTGRLEDVPGLVWREGAKVRSNPKAVVENLSSLELPAWDLVRPETYPESQHGAFFKQFPIAPIIMTRGCPYPCTFCAGNTVSGRRVRRRSVDNVLREITWLNKDFGIKEFHVVDDNFTMDTSYAKELLHRLRGLDLGMTWAVPNGVRMDALNRELLDLMKKTGLYMISLGIESGSDRMLGLMKKGITTSRIREKVSAIRDAGIDIAGFFILGFPGETEETMLQTIKFAAELPIMRANFFTYLPFPGSESYRELEASGELDRVDWKNLYFTNAAYAPVGITRKKLKSLHRGAFAKFYLRPHIMWYQMKSVRSPRHMFFLARRFLNWIVFN